LPLADLSMRVRLLDAAFAEAGLKLDQAKEALEKNALQDVSLLEAADEAEEAELIALHIRDLLARGEQKIALITPHRPLANRVMAELKACHIEADDTAGLPLRHTEAGVLTLLALDVLTGERSAHALLALLKHPLVCLEETRAVHLHKVRQMELEARHPQRPIPLSQQSMIRHVLAQLPPTHSSLPLAEWIAHLQHFLMRLMGPLSGSGVGAEAVQDLFDLFSAHLSSMDADAFRRLLADAVFSAAVRPPFDADPRVQVVGVFEAQFQHFECVILAGLVEGIWPGGSHDDPWLPGPVRVALGLPSSAQTISLMADVFCQQMGTPKVLMTRSRKMGGAPVMASRFLERLDTVLLAAQARPLWRTREEVLGWRQVLRQVDHVTPIQAPQPSPDATLRPKEFSATQLRLLMQNPYGFYAQQILQLIPLASLEQDLGPAELGSVLHAILEQDVRAGWHTLPDRLERLHHLALKMLTPWGHLPWVQHFVLPRVDLMLMHYVQHAQTTFEQVPLRFSELNGETTLACGDEVYRLRAKLDLLALTPSGAHVVDYKTGLLPSKKAVDRGEDPQLFMEAYLVARGGYGDLPAQLPQKAELWRLTTQGIEVLAAPGDMAQWLQQCEEVIEAVLAHYGAGGPMIAPTQMPSGWVRHLGRVDEWHT
ncbi:MAG: PD-(D/E)XK nuclease family protein, partial [Holosporales bacterium]